MQETLNHAIILHTCISMEIVGALPEPEEILPNTIISLFGIICKNVTESAECHFCLETIENEETRTFATPCCSQKVHCSCFGRWAATTVTTTGSTAARCAYCRTIFPSEQLCFLSMFSKKKKERRVAKTQCCRTTIHRQSVYCIATDVRVVKSRQSTLKLNIARVLTVSHCIYN